jgi:hypothetical protein
MLIMLPFSIEDMNEVFKGISNIHPTVMDAYPAILFAHHTLFLEENVHLFHLLLIVIYAGVPINLIILYFRGLVIQFVRW